MASLRLSIFEELKTDTASKLLDKRSLGFSQIRLLPKETGVRPIMNLRRRVVKKQNGRDLLGRSINSVMRPVSNMLNYEKVCLPVPFHAFRLINRALGRPTPETWVGFILRGRYVFKAQVFQITPKGFSW